MLLSVPTWWTLFLSSNNSSFFCMIYSWNSFDISKYFCSRDSYLWPICFSSVLTCLLSCYISKSSQLSKVSLFSLSNDFFKWRTPVLNLLSFNFFMVYFRSYISVVFYSKLFSSSAMRFWLCYIILSFYDLIFYSYCWWLALSDIRLFSAIIS